MDINSSSSGKKGNNLEYLIKKWNEFGLDAKKGQLDSQAGDVAEQQDAALQSRKTLAEETKSFKKQPETEKLKTVGHLLKLYQEEIDRLTKRSKLAENYFLQLYKELIAVPDPVHLLKSALEDSSKGARIVELESENERLNNELKQYKLELQDIQNQEVSLRRMEEKLREYESKMEDLIDNEVKNNQQRMSEQHQKTIDSLRERETENLAALERARKELQRAQVIKEETQTKLLEIQTKYEEELLTHQAQIEMLNNEVDRSNQRVQNLLREKDRLMEHLKDKPEISPEVQKRVEELEITLAQKDVLVSQLTERLQNFERAQKLDQAELEKLRIDLTANKQLLAKEREELEQLKKERKAESTEPDENELKQLVSEINFLKSSNPNHDSSEIKGNTNMEKLLKIKVRLIENEITKLKVLKNELEKENQDYKERYVEASEQVESQKKLIASLEEDLTNLDPRRKTNSFPEPDRWTKSNEDIHDINSPSFDSGNDQVGSDVRSPSKTMPEDHVMLQIVCSQRDRFKGRLMELESENRNLNKQKLHLLSEIESLRTDNVKLFQKIKYLQSYDKDTKQRMPISSAMNLISSANEDEIEVRYRKLYEDSVNPFVHFSKKESQVRYEELNPAEKVTLQTGRFFLSNKYARNFIFFYALALHLLVFVTIYRLAHYSCYQIKSTRPTL